jgi:hypothetical protein
VLRLTNGNHYSAGQVREVPWVAIPPVVAAIRVLERLVPEGGLLFDASVHTIPRGRVSTGRVFGYEAMRHRIEDFAIWASQLAVRWAAGTRSFPTTRTERSGWHAFAGRWPGTSPAARAAWSRWPSSTGTCAPR